MLKGARPKVMTGFAQDQRFQGHRARDDRHQLGVLDQFPGRHLRRGQDKVGYLEELPVIG
jgi:hypothetical protein